MLEWAGPWMRPAAASSSTYSSNTRISRSWPSIVRSSSGSAASQSSWVATSSTHGAAGSSRRWVAMGHVSSIDGLIPPGLDPGNSRMGRILVLLFTFA
jgi:hypothetical protein